ncbi:AAA family ATPase [Aeromonas veronii]|uniref:AAA family ATPase n=1 Tax=Aeromonas TaxID=642 RepID=UPI00192009E5|nr:AAA family ATPase [Aeromonas veronii]MBL0495182.1 AAA family ATPase [Aeromonas veronii]
MRLKSIFISEYKNLRNLNLDFESTSFLELFVGKNGSGKSNFFEALLEILRHIYEAKIKNRREPFAPQFSYKLSYIINENSVFWEYDGAVLSTDLTENYEDFFPDNVLIYYSGQNDNIAELLGKYEQNYRRNIDRAEIDDSRVFIGIGAEYKQLLLAVITLLPLDNQARQYVYEKLGLCDEQSSITFYLKRPRKTYARDVVIEEFDPRTHFWGLKALPREFVDRLLKCIRGEFQHRDIYNNAEQRYELCIDVALFRKEFLDLDSASLFSMFDNLKTLEMLEGIKADLNLLDDEKVEISFFSDGQFQSVYIYSLAEIFKSKNSITLLDEPDSFLHPEWQFNFLSQMDSISNSATSTNQILMTSHSAVTLMACSRPVLNSIKKAKNGDSEIVTLCKSDVIKSLSGNKIFLDENETIMSISTYLKNSEQPVLFTEGISDEYILDVAWKKLYQDQPRRFCIHNAFDRQFLRNLMSRDELRHNHPERKFFALFDFDAAYDDWNGISSKSKGQDIEVDPFKGLTRQLKSNNVALNQYVMLLPVPNVDVLKRQALKADNTPWGKGSDSHITVELLFYKENLLGTYFEKEPTSCGGERVIFSGDKVQFAKNYVPELDVEEFEIFRPMFELIISLINAEEAIDVA